MNLKQALLASFIYVLLSSSSWAADFYGINPGDTLRVFVWNEEELTQELLVGPDGTLSFPMVGNINVRGRPVNEVATLLSEGLGKFLRDEPLVTVSLIGTDGNKIYVHGEVLKPDAYVASREIDVVQALALAGGLTEYANRSEIRVVRRGTDGQQQVFEFNYDRFKSGRDLEQNIVLRAGDLLVVP